VRTASIIHPFIYRSDDKGSTSFYFNEIARRYIPESYHLHSRRREDPKSQFLNELKPEVIFGVLF
jgi:hypothetical protein